MKAYDPKDPVYVLRTVWIFLIDNREACLMCGRPEYLDCNDQMLCGRIQACIQHKVGDPIELLREVAKEAPLNDVEGDKSGGHILAAVRDLIK